MKEYIKEGIGIAIGLAIANVVANVVANLGLRGIARDKQYMYKPKERDPKLYEKLNNL